MVSWETAATVKRSKVYPVVRNLDGVTVDEETALSPSVALLRQQSDQAILCIVGRPGGM